jgi:lysophospholipase L1-like esterase
MIFPRSFSLALATSLVLSAFAKGDDATSAASGTTYNVIFIGDSITHGAGTAQPATQAAPVVCAQLLQQALPGSTFNVCNQGYVGFTTLGIAKHMVGIEKEVAPFLAAHPGKIVYTIMLGTNDSAKLGTNAATTPADYKTNLKSIVDAILALHPDATVFLERPIFYSPNTKKKDADYESPGPDLLKSYFPQITSLVADYAASHPNQVFEGDTKAYDYFALNYKTDIAPENGLDGTFYLHPNAKGAAALGKFWADAMAPHLGH